MKSSQWLLLVMCAVTSTAALSQNDLCDYYLPQCAAKFDQYSKAAKQLDVQVKNRELSKLEAAQKAIALSDSLYPRDGLLANINRQNLVMAQFAQRNQLSDDQMSGLDSSATDTFRQAILERFAAAKAAQEVGQFYSQYQATQQYQPPQQNPANTAAIATMLNGIGKAFTNSFGQSITPPPRICNYYGSTSYCF
ncbi:MULTISPECIES: hypothetical protein [unclassified Polynucleobacter]|jgi:hypothetical protein|uniref:hypothetical protein n=1 Tax=unclassified Polynucleobacter TaxID=2640945 RepID=UPI000BD551EC|nr:MULTISPECIES: hypothetical protein [unclassified Polynucleobacter]OYY21371.1 MAG: hypothetical protein B7Y67_02140 [Polynucleobacter sp. 35-46-11]OZA78060.1 MAG: hypothetical protein B7X71_02595 [Polynucleobacter sp. 39-46-10]